MAGDAPRDLPELTPNGRRGATAAETLGLLGDALGQQATRALIRVRCSCRDSGALLAVVYEQLVRQQLPGTDGGLSGPSDPRVLLRYWNRNRSTLVPLADIEPATRTRLYCADCRCVRFSPPACELLERAAAKVAECRSARQPPRVDTIRVAE